MSPFNKVVLMSWKTFKESGKLPEGSPLKKLGLLVVDDESEIIESLGEIFKQSFDIFSAVSAREGLELFKEHAPKLILSDQRMPEMSGLQLLERIKAINPDTVRILVTGYSDINVVIDGLNRGLLWKYVTKPWDNEELKALVMEGARNYVREHGLDESAFRFSGFLGF
ncbi:MAG: hypothetical protein AUK47_08680 [Deltaproteobacteria bacterium CG2_30_63_29]|nr:MAG: hypothetical protein AUK47_08680 [Deltaproteobacteria bacterium CG2_30_63_29]PIV98129.1 MAG: two-component system response regulator [Deltaproteobacteria bacterium CG17_big_fil_post_rev_8_21_14_2_50_63_7]PJB46806.1 MAG: two-component system response regulator [Deltaproteobacteria bacterium CG_4_9_14_3_um_filter_63_12]